MSDPKTDDLPHYVPVPPGGNGHKVRPDLQTKIVSGIVLLVILGSIKWAGDKLDTLSTRMTAIETKVEERFKASDELTKERVDRLIDKLEEVNRRLESLEKQGAAK